MSSDDIPKWLWNETWWSWNRPPNEPYLFTDIACHYFNLLEATAWFVFAVLVLLRWRRYQRSTLELLYVFAFLTFGISDLIEAWQLTSWLLWCKLVNLIVLLIVRRTVLCRWYPDHRLF